MPSEFFCGVIAPTIPFLGTQLQSDPTGLDHRSVPLAPSQVPSDPALSPLINRQNLTAGTSATLGPARKSDSIASAGAYIHLICPLSPTEFDCLQQLT